MVADKGWGENHQFPALNHRVIEVTLRKNRKPNE